MNLNKTLERVNDNKVISSNGDKVHEISFEPGKVVIQERGKEPPDVHIWGNSYSRRQIQCRNPV